MSDSVPSEIDRKRLERVGANLLDNAQVHGGGPVRVELGADQTATVLAVSEEGDPCQTQTVFVGLRSVGEPLGDKGVSHTKVVGMYDTVWGDVYAYDATREVASKTDAAVHGGVRV